MAFVKLDCGILNSTIWMDRDAREVFITALLMALPDELTEAAPQLEIHSLKETGYVVPPGWYGFVPAAGVGILRQAGMDRKRGLAALERLGAPEPDSRSKEYAGRRLVRVDGGFVVLNFVKYRERDHTAAERSRRYRERLRAKEELGVSRVASITSRVASRSVTQADAEAEAEAEANTTKPSAPKAARPTWLTPFGEAWTSAYGGLPAYGKLAVSLRPLIKAHPAGEVLEHWTRYLETTDGQYASAARFAQTYGQYGKRQREPEGVPDMYLTLEEQAARNAKHTPTGPESVSDILKRVAP